MPRPDRSAGPHVLSVGQCGFDHATISGFLADHCGARVEPATGLADARRALGSGRFDLVLVNRVLDRDGSSGLEVIRSLKGDPDPAISGVPLMLVSNLTDAQRSAVELGAVAGFGKNDLYRDSAKGSLDAVLGE